MAKCLMCSTKKGKRFCKIVDGLVCSLCCGTTRNEEQCLGCEFYKSEKESRKYKQVPHYTPPEMEADFEFQNISDVIESAFCSVDANANFQLPDEVAKQTLEKLMDVYHYGDKELSFGSEIVENCFTYVNNSIHTNLIDTTDREILVKVIGAIYFVLIRRTRGNREYFKIILRHVGVEDGIRVL